MPKDQAPSDQTDRRDRETRGGYPAGGKQISEFRPPPPGPAPGGKRPEGGVDAPKDPRKDRENGDAPGE